MSRSPFALIDPLQVLEDDSAPREVLRMFTLFEKGGLWFGVTTLCLLLIGSSEAGWWCSLIKPSLFEL